MASGDLWALGLAYTFMIGILGVWVWGFLNRLKNLDQRLAAAEAAMGPEALAALDSGEPDDEDDDA